MEPTLKFTRSRQSSPTTTSPSLHHPFGNLHAQLVSRRRAKNISTDLKRKRLMHFLACLLCGRGVFVPKRLAVSLLIFKHNTMLFLLPACFPISHGAPANSCQHSACSLRGTIPCLATMNKWEWQSSLWARFHIFLYAPSAYTTVCRFLSEAIRCHKLLMSSSAPLLICRSLWRNPPASWW